MQLKIIKIITQTLSPYSVITNAQNSKNVISRYEWHFEIYHVRLCLCSWGKVFYFLVCLLFFFCFLLQLLFSTYHLLISFPSGLLHMWQNIKNKKELFGKKKNSLYLLYIFLLTAFPFCSVIFYFFRKIPQLFTLLPTTWYCSLDVLMFFISYFTSSVITQ